MNSHLGSYFAFNCNSRKIHGANKDKLYLIFNAKSSKKQTS